MKKITFVLLANLLLTPAYALDVLNDDELQSVEGQAGADLSLRISLNQKFDQNTSKYVFDEALCKDLEYCRFALALNNRYIKNGQPSSSDGNKLWLVFKGIQGTINIQKLGLDGMDLTYKANGGADKIKAVMQLSFDASKPIQSRNFGFNALAFGQDKFTSNATSEVGSSLASDYGYLQVSKYSASNAPNSAYDHGRETGFMGLQMNGNLAMQGKIMIFGCDSTHPRC